MNVVKVVGRMKAVGTLYYKKIFFNTNNLFTVMQCFSNQITANVTDKGSRWVLKALHNFHQIVPNGEAYFSVTVTCDETYTCVAQMQPLCI